MKLHRAGAILNTAVSVLVFVLKLCGFLIHFGKSFSVRFMYFPGLRFGLSFLSIVLFLSVTILHVACLCIWWTSSSFRDEIRVWVITCSSWGHLHLSCSLHLVLVDTPFMPWRVSWYTSSDSFGHDLVPFCRRYSKLTYSKLDMALLVQWWPKACGVCFELQYSPYRGFVITGFGLSTYVDTTKPKHTGPIVWLENVRIYNVTESFNISMFVVYRTSTLRNKMSKGLLWLKFSMFLKLSWFQLNG